MEKELRIVNEYLKQERADHQETQKELRKIKESLKGVQANCKGLQQNAKKGKNDERDLISSKAQKAYECRNEMAAIIEADIKRTETSIIRTACSSLRMTICESRFRKYKPHPRS